MFTITHKAGYTSPPYTDLSVSELMRLPDVAQFISNTRRVTAETLYNELGIPLRRADQYFKLLVRMNVLERDPDSEHPAYRLTR